MKQRLPRGKYGVTRVVVQPTRIETESGAYEVWVEKMFCLNQYYFFAEQLSIKAFGQHHWVNPQIRSFELLAPHPAPEERSPSLCVSNVTRYQIDLKRFNSTYLGSNRELKWQFTEFCMYVKRVKNESRKIS